MVSTRAIQNAGRAAMRPMRDSRGEGPEVCGEATGATGASDMALAITGQCSDGQPGAQAMGRGGLSRWRVPPPLLVVSPMARETR